MSTSGFAAKRGGARELVVEIWGDSQEEHRRAG
ncbi:UNVERIFIED_ORG: hypothetical protein J2X79_002705 [Arthrobacter globiformis]|nr:hypothetical protein [Arthrobacter globiformis]